MKGQPPQHVYRCWLCPRYTPEPRWWATSQDPTAAFERHYRTKHMENHDENVR